MREFTRITLRILMVVFLLVGCGQNFYYLTKLTENASNTSYHRDRYNNNTYYDDVEEVEETEYPSQEENVEYPDYNRPMSPY